MALLFQLVQIGYWASLATWFGGVLFMAIGGRVIFSTVEENKPYLTGVLSVNLEGQHGTLLAGTIVGNLMRYYIQVELVCAGGLVITTFMQFFLIDLRDSAVLIDAVLRTILLIGAVTALLYDWRVLWPKIWQYRQEFLDHADEPERANPALDQFNRFQRSSWQVLQMSLFLLVTLLVFSVQIAPAHAPPVAAGPAPAAPK
ncbi:MAG TPA: hypothetical protein VMD30_00485 [Tepidisphaeraceae bacterium]|nr:hypothetical protein [Tepidisphaeraceae bacterium]